MTRNSLHGALNLLLIVNLCFTSACTQEEQTQRSLVSKLVGRSADIQDKGSLLLFLDRDYTELWEKGDSLELIRELDLPAVKIQPALMSRPKNMAAARRLGLDRCFEIAFEPYCPMETVLETLEQNPHVEAYQYNHTRRAAPVGEVKAAAKSSEEQWNLEMINLAQARGLCTPDSQIVVAVVDGPVNYGHRELTENMWLNVAERDGLPGVDDDGNGYIDDVYGYNFAQNKGEIDWSASDEIGHATHVAGIVNSIATGVRIMSAQVFYGSSQSSSDRQVGNAFIYAADNGACIAQCSYGYDGGTYKTDNSYINKWPFEYRALKYFTDPENANSPVLESNILVFAAGNETASYSSYPGALPFCVSVTAVNRKGYPATYTNYGLGCNIAAPGGDDDEGLEGKILSTGIAEINGEYAYMSGTSMACPHVSGVVALGLSYANSLGKHFTNEEFMALLYASVEDLDSKLSEASWKSYYKRMGTGLVDAWRMLMQVEGTPCALVAAGKESRIDLKPYFGMGAATLTYTSVELDAEQSKSLGIVGEPQVKDGVLSIRCTAQGCGKIRIKAIAGGSVIGGPNGTGGSEIVREISLISRCDSADNNAWL